MSETTEVVALIDADVIPYSQWLRDLVRPLSDSTVGATTGVRWYVPRSRWTWGTLVRSVWNAMACAQMYVFHIPWAGSMAIRADLFRHHKLLDRWARSFVEDTATYEFLRSRGLRLQYVPTVTMVNHETVSLGDCFRFIRRQLLCARLYHESWPTVATVGLGTPLALTAGFATALAVDGPAGWGLIAGLGASLAFYAAGMAIALSWADRRINSLARERGSEHYPYSWRSLLAVPLTQVVYLASLASASFLRQIEWRGITYQLEGAGRVRLLGYQPYQRAAHMPAADTSLV